MLSGIQPTFQLHLGNYLGALRNWAQEQERYDNFFCIVDSPRYDAAGCRRWCAAASSSSPPCSSRAGLDPDANVLFVQSQVPAHAQLGWILECHTPLGWLERMTQFKAKGGSGPDRERAAAGLLTYPTLMAADILLYDTDLRPRR